MNHLKRMTQRTLDQVFGNCFPLTVGSIFDSDIGSGAIWQVDYLQHNVDIDWGDFVNRFSKQLVSEGSMPRIDVLFDEENQKYIIRAAVAGIPKDQISVTIDGDRLIFKHVSEKKENPKMIKIHGEISVSSFEKTVKLPDTADLDKISISYENGIIEVVVPIQESKKPRQLSF